MKTWITQTVASVLTLAAIGLTACKKDEVQATLTPAAPPTLTASTNTVVLTQATAANNAVTYTWTPISSFNWANTNNSYNPNVTYSLQLDKQGNNFASAVSTDLTSSPSTLTVGSLNTMLISLGLTPGTATPVEARIKAIYAANAPVYSSSVALTATPYKACVAPNSDTWSIIGPAGVDWDTDVALTYNCDTRTYDLTRTLAAGEFKFRKNRNWTVSYGSTTARSASGTAPLDTNNNNNISVPTAGTYTLSLDLNNMTYTLKQ
jgi:hypothetical protein